MTIKNPHTIYIRESYSDKIKAIFSSTTSKETEEVNLKRIKSSDDYNTYSCTGDYKKYDRVMFIGDDTDKSMVLVFNKYVSGYHLEAGSSEGNVGIPFVYDEKEEDAKYETVSLKYNKDKEKNIFIYTPKGYFQRHHAAGPFSVWGRRISHPLGGGVAEKKICESGMPGAGLRAVSGGYR